MVDGATKFAKTCVLSKLLYADDLLLMVEGSKGL